MDANTIEQALNALNEFLEYAGSDPVQLVVCGGAGLILTGLVSRTTEDVDIVALLNSEGELYAPVPLPEKLYAAVSQVAEVLGINENWLNNGPSSDEGGLFQLGLPEGLAERLTRRVFGSHVTVYFVGRFDQICFKVYAAADRGRGRHYNDLLQLNPTLDELERAAGWARTHDPSDGFQFVLSGMLNEMGHHELADRI